MNLSKYITDMDARIALAKSVGTIPEYIYQIAAGHRQPSPKLALKIEAATGISRSELRPDIYPPADSKRRRA